MLKKYLNLLCLVALCSTLDVNSLTKEMLDHFKQYPDYTNHFIFFNQATLQSIRSDLQVWGSEHDIKFYMNDCKRNKLPECEKPEDTPLILMYNRVLIRYNSHPKNLQDMKDWIESRIMKNTHLVNHEEELVKLLNQKPNVYCFCTTDKLSNDESVFFALAKTLPFLNYCVIRNSIFYQKLGLKPGNLTFFKNSTTNREEFVYPNRLDAWEWFVKSHMLHTIPRVQPLASQRFTQKEKKIDAYILTCDLSFTCEKVWARVRDLDQKLSNESLGFDFYIAIQDQQESFSFNLYYHLSFNMSQVPAFVHISLISDSQRSGDLVRHIQYTDKDFTIQKLKAFKRSVKNNKVQPFYFSDKIPKSKNGFTGKGSEKLIQKVVAENVKEVIKNSPNHYLLLASALDIGCSKCEEFYRDYKQIASLLVEKDVTFGYLNANKNEIMIQQVAQLPDLLLYKKDDKDNPIRLNIPPSFDHLRNFLRDNLGDAYFNPDQL